MKEPCDTSRQTALADDDSTNNEVAEMNALQEAIRLKLLATYQANLTFFQEKFPHVYEDLMKCEPVIPFSLTEDGQVWINHKSH
ncbi:MAG TPA: hypothetical protein VJ572_09135, partial [Azonexus sp.]|nr:hypothetical protein [Azonexus sp.]